MISCSEAVRRLWEYLDDIVEDTERGQIDEHLQRCRRCCGELEFARELKAKLAGAAVEDLPTDVLARLHRTIEGLSR